MDGLGGEIDRARLPGADPVLGQVDPGIPLVRNLGRSGRIQREGEVTQLAQTLADPDLLEGNTPHPLAGGDRQPDIGLGIVGEHPVDDLEGHRLDEPDLVQTVRALGDVTGTGGDRGDQSSAPGDVNPVRHLVRVITVADEPHDPQEYLLRSGHVSPSSPSRR